MKIVHIETILSRGTYSESKHWEETRSSLHRAVQKCEWPPGSGSFTIFPKRKANGVKPIRAEFIAELKHQNWTIEGEAKNGLGKSLGDFDAVLLGPEGPVVAEWETGNISSSHRSLNKLTMLASEGIIAAGTLIVPTRKLYPYLTDRIGNYSELEPYLKFWKSVPCNRGILEIVVIEHDFESWDVPQIPKGTDGRAKG